MACYEDLRQALAATAKERDELRRENTALKAICEKQADMTGKVAAMALELDDAKAEINRLNRENFEQSTLIASLRAELDLLTEALKSGADACDVCAHNRPELSCVCIMECADCTVECPCKGCSMGSNFEAKKPEGK